MVTAGAPEWGREVQSEAAAVDVHELEPITLRFVDPKLESEYCTQQFRALCGMHVGCNIALQCYTLMIMLWSENSDFFLCNAVCGTLANMSMMLVRLWLHHFEPDQERARTLFGPGRGTVRRDGAAGAAGS